MPCTYCKCLLSRQELVADGLGLFTSCPDCAHLISRHRNPQEEVPTTPRTIGGEKSRTARDAIGRIIALVQVAQECRIQVEVEGVSMWDKTSSGVRELLQATIPDKEVAAIALGLSDHVYDESKFPKMNLRELQSKSEKWVQDSLNESLFGGAHDAVDCHAVPRGPNAKMPQTAEDYWTNEEIEVEGVYFMTGTPTAMGPAIDLEIKAKKAEKSKEVESSSEKKKAMPETDDSEAFGQALERIIVRANLAGHLRRCAVLCATSKKCWAFAFTRGNDDDRSLRGITRVFTVNYEDLDVLWGMWIQRVQADPYHILTTDGPLLIRTLESINYDIGYCRVKFLVESAQSRVYLVSLPQNYMTASEGRVLGVKGRPDFVIKVFFDPSTFDTEISALQRLLEHEFKQEELHALASFPKAKEALFFHMRFPPRRPIFVPLWRMRGGDGAPSSLPPGP